MFNNLKDAAILNAIFVFIACLCYLAGFIFSQNTKQRTKDQTERGLDNVLDSDIE